MKLKTLLSLVFLILISVAFAQDIDSKKDKVKNVILLIGDGMGVSQVSAGIYWKDIPLQMERAQYVGLIKTHSASDLITDSGAGGTAIATGSKTRNWAIGVDKNNKEVKNILEYARDNNKSTGVISTKSITDATPASFLAHNKHRKNNQEIAMDIFESNANVLIGGGKKHFSERNDHVNLLDSFRIKGYQVVDATDKIATSGIDKVVCFQAESHLPKMSEDRGDFLTEGTQKSLKILEKNNQGFFLLIEGALIDWGGHDNDIDYVVAELLDFDKAVGVAFDYADNHPGTLVLVTADHETGGLAITGGKKGKIKTIFSTKGHSATLVPVFAYGAGSELFSGVYENTDVFNRIMKAFGFEK